MSYRIWMISVLFVALLARPLWATVITQPDGSSFDVSLIDHTGNNWTYQVTELAGKDLSHWVLVLGLCLDHVTDVAPTNGLEIGFDASTGYTGIKWNAPFVGSSPWTFTISMDDDYPLGDVTAVVKAGSEHATGIVDGSVCSDQAPDDPQQPTSTSTATATEEATATQTATPTNTATGEPISTVTNTATATNTPDNGTIPPATNMTTATATNVGGTIPPATATATMFADAPTADVTASQTPTGTFTPHEAPPTGTLESLNTPQAPTSLTPTIEPPSGGANGMWLNPVYEQYCNPELYDLCEDLERRR